MLVCPKVGNRGAGLQLLQAQEHGTTLPIAHGARVDQLGLMRSAVRRAVGSKGKENSILQDVSVGVR